MLRNHKYNATKVELDGFKFDSKFESICYTILKDNNCTFTLQPEFVIQPSFKDVKKTILPVKYKADFLITNNSYTYILDSKGFITPEFKLKKKLLLYQGFRIICVSSQIDMLNFIEAEKQELSPYEIEQIISNQKKERKKKKNAKRSNTNDSKK